MKVLTTGTRSGLGRYLYEKLGGMGLSRDTPAEEVETIKNSHRDVIVHCAFNSQRGVNSESFYDYIEDNVNLTRNLTSYPHRKFVFISSVDVYPKDGGRHKEDEVISVDSVSGIYPVTKLMSESIVREHCDDHLILRASSLLGKYSRKNSLIRIAEDTKDTLSLAGASTLNFALYSDMLEFIKCAVQKNISGVFNLVSSENITLAEVAEMLGKNVKFGDYSYFVGNIDNSKACSVLSAFNKTSREVVNRFVKERYG